MNDPSFRRCAHALRTECPTSMGVRVIIRRAVRITDWLGYCNVSRDGTYLNITIATRARIDGRIHRVTPFQQRDTLMHEWAHAMGWAPSHPSVTDHDATWGVNYSKVYAAVVED